MSKVTLDTKELSSLIEKLKIKGSVKVGILGDGSARDGSANNAEIGLAHEFGSQSKGIPVRSFIRMPLEKKAGELASVVTSNIATQAIEKGNMDLVLNLIGIKAQGIIQEAFTTGGFGEWQRNSDETIERKGDDSPLQDTIQLKRSISWKVAS